MRKFTTKILHLDVPKDKRIIVISDVHGYKDYLKNLLEIVKFSKEDELFLLGDYIERGQQNVECLRYVMKLSKLRNVHAIIGNNDAFIATAVSNPNYFKSEMLLRNMNEKIFWHGTCTLKQMADEVGVQMDTPENIPSALEKIKEHFKEELDFLYSLPTIIDTENFVFVHAGLPHLNFDELQTMEPFAFTKNDDFMSQNLYFEKNIVVGHWPTILYGKTADCSPYINREQKIISIDGGCGVKDYGQVNALIIPNINSLDFSFLKYDDLEKIIARKTQKEKQATVKITWQNNEVEILEQDKYVTKILHVSSGKTAWVPSDLILKLGDKLCCHDFTDYMFEVKQGEELDIVYYKEKFGYMIKKDSKIGWYNP